LDSSVLTLAQAQLWRLLAVGQMGHSRMADDVTSDQELQESSHGVPDRRHHQIGVNTPRRDNVDCLFDNVDCLVVECLFSSFVST
jgi:hypothetical protein